jgi:hypothetical protein
VGTVNLWQLFVRPAWQGRGVGRCLMRSPLGEAHRRGFARLRLWTPRAPLAAGASTNARAGRQRVTSGMSPQSGSHHRIRTRLIATARLNQNRPPPQPGTWARDWLPRSDDPGRHRTLHLGGHRRRRRRSHGYCSRREAGLSRCAPAPRPFRAGRGGVGGRILPPFARGSSSPATAASQRNAEATSRALRSASWRATAAAGAGSAGGRRRVSPPSRVPTQATDATGGECQGRRRPRPVARR